MTKKPFFDGQIEARDITNVPTNTPKLPDDKYFQIECTECSAIQTFMLRDGKLSLIKSVHQH